MRWLSLALLLVAAHPASAHHSALHFGGSGPQLLEPERAFRFSAQVREGAVEVRFAIADGYYLYRDKLRFAAEGNPAVRLGAAELPAAQRYKDQFFGEVGIYRKEVRIRVPAQGEGRFDLKVTSQGCADIGVCYVPMESNASLTLAAFGGAAPQAPAKR